jgi:uncharacterized protein (UPF0335 family)
MIVTIHQPEHFPYMGFFQKMQAADLFVILDNVKYRKNYFQNRNRFLNKQNREEWFTVPVRKNCISNNIKDVLAAEDHGWKKKLIKQMQANFNTDFTEIYEGDKLLDMNMRSIEFCKERLSIDVPVVMASDLDVSGDKTDLLLDICKKTGAESYLSGPSGRDYLDMSKFQSENINVNFFQPNVNNLYTALYNIKI